MKRGEVKAHTPPGQPEGAKNSYSVQGTNTMFLCGIRIPQRIAGQLAIKKDDYRSDLSEYRIRLIDASKQ